MIESEGQVDQIDLAFRHFGKLFFGPIGILASCAALIAVYYALELDGYVELIDHAIDVFIILLVVALALGICNICWLATGGKGRTA
jgi:hypothetical protein